MHNIQYTTFIERQFNKGFSGTKLKIEDKDNLLDFINNNYNENILQPSDNDFCKYLILKNISFDSIKSSVIPITLDIYPFIRTTYSARTETELPILTRFAQLPPGFDQPKANYICCILYTREQLEKEHTAQQTDEPFELTVNCKYGIVAVMGTAKNEVDPYVPVTMMRNALGMKYGGNSVPINVIQYNKSVEFWNNHIIVK